MPFPWKKNKVTRISQIVADLQSPKRGGSLVVETGFPTSLIDLFVKNRSRFKKPKSKKRVQLEISDPQPPAFPPPLPPPPTQPLSSGNRLVVRPEPGYTHAPSLRQLIGDREDLPKDGAGQDCNRVDERVGGSDANMVLAAILKMFVAVVLILSVKKFTVGITMAAFVLLFLEYAGKRVICCMKPCSNANNALNSLAQRVSTCVWFQMLARNQKKNSEGSAPAEAPVSEVELSTASSSRFPPSSSCIEEIKIVERNNVRDICFEGTNFAGPDLNFDSIDGDKKWGCSEKDEDLGNVVEQYENCECKMKVDRSGSAKFKSKVVKKLFPKKLRGSKKEKKEMKEKKSKEREAESCSEVSSTVEEVRMTSFEIEEEHDGIDKEDHDSRNRSPLLLLPSKLECIKDDEVIYGMAHSNESSLVKEEEVGVSNKEERVGRGGNWPIKLFVIALAGLLVGRFPAMLLTLGWLFMPKIANTRGRSLNVNGPLSKCCVPGSW